MSPIRMERVETALRLVIAFNEAFNRHDVPAMTVLMRDDCLFESPSPPPGGSVYRGKPAITQYWQDFFAGSPEAHLKVEDLFGMGLRCVMQWKGRWTAAGGSPVEVRGVDIFRVQDGFICEHFSYIKG